MAGNTVGYTARNSLCCGCGVCKGICPKDCISWERKEGLFLPHIDERLCLNCGLCAAVCPGLKHDYEPKDTAEDTVTGPVLACFSAWSRDPALRHAGASGGVVSTIIRALLKTQTYDGAFCLDSYDYRAQLKTRLYTADEVETCWSQSSALKSRYLPVSHEDAVRYIRKNRDKKLILVGTSCAIRGLRSAIEKLNLCRDQYLFIGLFCDQVFNYNVLSYFENAFAAGASVTALHFKNKESGGWPGDMKLFPQDGEPFYVPMKERMKAKAYFIPERCLYCVDKLNVCSDIALGDNYTGKDDSSLGSNSVIIRTQAGMHAFTNAQTELETCPAEIQDIQKAQYLSGRLNHLYFAKHKEQNLGGYTALNTGVPYEQDWRQYTRAWQTLLRRKNTGAQYHTDPQRLLQQMQKDQKGDSAPVRFLKRAFHYLQRRIGK